MENAAKTLAANIRFASVDNPVRSVVVASSVSGEGKTTVTLELARALAASGRRTLLLECDMRKRSLAATLGKHGRHGIYAVLTGEAGLADSVVPTGTRNLFFLDVEPNIPNPTDILGSKRFKNLLASLTTEYSYVVLDTPPLSVFVDAAILSATADATVMVVRQNYTRRDTAVAAFEQLRQANANVIGTVLNCCDDDYVGYGGDYHNYYSHEAVRQQPASQAQARPAAAQPAVRRAPQAQVAQQRPVAAPSAQAVPAQVPVQPQPAVQPVVTRRPTVPASAPVSNGRLVSPESTAQFLAGTSYAPRDYEE